MKLPDSYYDYSCYWAHMLTFRCSSSCDFCILNARGKCSKADELTGSEILDFWNNIEHKNGQRLSIIGGEPTLHPDLVDIVNNLENYYITITTNCKSPFYNDNEFYKKFKPKNSTLRINTTFHPNHISPQEYIRIIKLYRQSGYFVDQTSYVNVPEIKKYSKEIDMVRKEIKINCPPYLGFYNSGEKFDAPFMTENNEPNEKYPDNSPASMCGITNYDAYRDLCGQGVKREVSCEHPKHSLIIGPSGNHYHCHYKLYYDIDPICNIKDFKFVADKNKNCKHYGFCNWCDIQRVGCKKNKTAKNLVLNKLYDKRERDREEIQYLMNDIRKFAQQNNDLEFNELKWFEYAYSLLYSGHRHRGNVLDVGSAKSVFPYYLSHKGYKVTTVDVADSDFRCSMKDKFGVAAIDGDIRDPLSIDGKFDMITALSVVEHIDKDTQAVINLSKLLKPGGVIVISSDFYDKYIEYPNANRTIVTDRPQGSHTDSRVYTGNTFINRIINPLEKTGIKRIGDTNFNNIDIGKKEERSVRGLYTFGLTTMRKI